MAHKDNRQKGLKVRGAFAKVSIMEQTPTSFEYNDLYSGLRFAIFPDHAEVTGVAESLFSVEVPAEVNGLPVTRIAPHAFEGQAVPEVWLPDSVTEIAAYGFSDCAALQEIELPADLSVIGPYAFYHCKALEAVTLHDALADVDNAAFLACENLREMTLLADHGNYGCLKPILSELFHEVRVTFEDAEGRFSVVFPEYFIEYIELPEARVFDEDTHGSGRVYRKFFNGKTFDIASYDNHFTIACLKDSPAQAGRVAVTRLLSPRGMIASAKERYEAWLAAHVQEACLPFAAAGDEEALTYLINAGILKKDDLPVFLDAARKSGRVQTVVRLMQAARQMG